LAFHPETHKLYVCDVGPDKDDEIDLIEKGGNYGWPEVVGKSDNPKYINPITSYTPVITPVQGVFVGRDLYFGSYNEGTVHKLTLSGEAYDQVKKDEIVYKGEPATVVGVFYGPDSQFYLTTANQIIRFQPKVESASNSQ
jgi:glucose/arabinose dehydrogenase